MKLIRVILTVALLTFFGSQVKAGDSFIHGMISPIPSILTSAQIQRDRDPVINIYIHSGGGYLMAGEWIIDAIHQRQSEGAIVVCHVSIAMSEAFTILQQCDYRIATPNARFMQHHTRFVNPATGYVSEPLRYDVDNIYRLLGDLERIDLTYFKYLEDFVEPERIFGPLEALSIGAIDSIAW